jgi:hypothetical protein
MFKNDKLTAAFFTVLVFAGMLVVALLINFGIQYFGTNFIMFGLIGGMFYIILSNVYNYFLHSLEQKNERRI